MVFNKEQLQAFITQLDLQTPEDLKALLGDMTTEIIQAVYEGELTAHLGYAKHQMSDQPNSRNGYSIKHVKSLAGELELHPPRDRQGTFTPQLVKKRQTDLAGIEPQVLSLYAKGLSTRDIRDHLAELYDIALSAATISTITDRVLDQVREWQQRPLDPIYPILFLDGLVMKLRRDGQIQPVTVYLIFGYTVEGYKACLGLYLAETESASYWLTVLNELKQRGVADVLIFSVDNLTGFSEAIATAFPLAIVQKCVVHQIRNSLKFVPWRERKAVAHDLKAIYTAPTEAAGRHQLEVFATTWEAKYPYIAQSWQTHWAELATFFRYAEPIRTLIYTTNPIENLHRQLRKITKTRPVFPTEEALVKLLYLGLSAQERTWTQRRQNWGRIYAELRIFFPDRLERSEEKQ